MHFGKVNTCSETLEWTDQLIYLLAQLGKDAGAKIICCGLCPFYSQSTAGLLPPNIGNTFFPKGASTLSIEMLDCGVGGLVGQEWKKDTGRWKTCMFGRAAALEL